MAADEGGDDMKRRAAILMIMVMASLWQQAISLDQSDSMRSPGPDHSSNPLPGSAIKKMKERMAESLAALPSYSVRGAADILQSSPEGNDSLGNGSRENGSLNSSLLQNVSSLNNISLESEPGNSSLSGQQIQADAARANSGSGQFDRFKSSYAARASRHEIGKGGVDSSFFLEGVFEMDKSIKFQDRGF